MDYSTDKIPQALLGEIKDALEGVRFGSVEIYVQNKTVTQITVRNIKKMDENVVTKVQYPKKQATQ